MNSVLRDIVATCLPGFVMVALSLAAAEIGFRVGRRLKSGADEALRSEVYTLESATLALLALFLGFSFSIGVSAYENRRQVMLNEAVVIAKAYKRADLLPEPEASEIRSLLVQYVDTRLDLFYQGVLGERRVRDKLRESQRLQREMWARASSAGKRDPNSTTVGLAVEAVSEISDLNIKRIMALQPAEPSAMLIALGLTAAVAMGWVGCGIGLGPRRNTAMTLVLSVLFGFIVAIIVDLDRPRHGIVRASQRALIDVQETLKQAP